MAKMIPDQATKQETPSKAERAVFNWFCSNDVPGVVLHSLIQKNHRYKLIGETDFFYICEHGILCIEVKGGKISREKGKWYSEDGQGIKHHIKNPFEQAKQCKYATDDYLRSINQHKGILVGYGVIFPDCIFYADGNDLVTEVLFDNKYDLSEFPDRLSQMFKHWLKEENEKKPNVKYNKLSASDIEKYQNIFRGDIKTVLSLNLSLQTAENKIIRLSNDQMEIMYSFIDNDRLIVNGLVGTGKTLMAIERFKACSSSGKKVAYICFNNNIAAHVSESLKGFINDGYAGTFHKLIMKYDDKQKWYITPVDELSSIFLDRAIEMEKYDYLIVDEAQDLMYEEVLLLFDNILKGGLEKGKWVLFLDPHQNIYNNSEVYNKAWHSLTNDYNPALFNLRKNFRNTKEISEKTVDVTGFDELKSSDINGHKVVIREYGDKKAFLKFFKEDIKSLLDGGISISDMVILSRHTKKNSILADEKSLCSHDIKELKDLLDIDERALYYSTVYSFKGLESKIVFLVDIDGFSGEKDRMLNYVAMSRARLLLYVYISVDKHDEYESVVSE